MASRNGRSSLRGANTSSNGWPLYQQTRPDNTRSNFGRSNLRSAEEQLRDLRDGDTSWQHNNDSSLRKSQDSDGPVLPGASHIQNTQTDRVATQQPLVRVYLHHVRKTDTLPLILFAYEISATVLNKANRLWATDSVQSREELYLPVEKCGVKPAPCSPPPQESECQQPRKQDGNLGNPLGIRGIDNGSLRQDIQFLEPEKQLDEWVLIPGIGPVQIASLPTHKLSYFPAERRGVVARRNSSPVLDSLVVEDKIPRDSIDSDVLSRSSIGSLVEDGVGRIVRYWQDNQGRKKWEKIGKDLIELL